MIHHVSGVWKQEGPIGVAEEQAALEQGLSKNDVEGSRF